MKLNQNRLFRTFTTLGTALSTLGLALGCVTLGTLATPAMAQDYPNKAIRLIVPTPAGSGPDVDARQLAVRLSPLLGQPVIVENRPGASARIATELVAKAAPDGYTFLVGTPSSLATAPSLYANLPYDVKRDFAPVSLVSTTAFALTVNATVPAQNVAGYVAMVNANQRFANVGTVGIGTVPHLAAAWFGWVAKANLKFVHYNTSTPFNDLLAGETSAVFEALLPVMGNVKAGKLRVLAISGKSRHPLFPDVPTFTESGVAGYDPVVWIGILAPAGTPPAIVNRVSAAIAQVARMPEIIAQRRETVSESVGGTPEEFAAFLEGERAKWGAVIKQVGLKLE